MKKLMMAAISLMMATSVNAQKILNESTTPFEESKFYISASLSGLTLNYSKASDWSFGLSAKAGYLFLDNWMALGVFDYQNYSSGTVTSTNIEINVGYAFFLGHYVTLEPELFYEQSFKNSDYTRFGLRLGLGVYF